MVINTRIRTLSLLGKVVSCIILSVIHSNPLSRSHNRKKNMYIYILIENISRKTHTKSQMNIFFPGQVVIQLLQNHT